MLMTMNATRTILLATNNPHKLDEITAIIDTSQVKFITLAEAGVDSEEPIEDADTFAGNAMIKARYYAEHCDMPCLADDSGLCVDALGGAPGVISARYSGMNGPRAEVDRANNAKLVAELRSIPQEQRTARFVCTMALMDRTGMIAQTRGTIEGLIIDTPRGDHGFGYDPHFLLPERNRTTAELSPQDKNAISHRGNATRHMLDALRRLGWL